MRPRSYTRREVFVASRWLSRFFDKQFCCFVCLFCFNIFLFISPFEICVFPFFCVCVFSRGRHLKGRVLGCSAKLVFSQCYNSDYYPPSGVNLVAVFEGGVLKGAMEYVRQVGNNHGEITHKSHDYKSVQWVIARSTKHLLSKYCCSHGCNDLRRMA